MTEFKQAL